jgi:hypothetical protein
MTTLSLLAIWTWGSASMLLWGLAAAIPLVLHWWSRRRFEEVPWAAMEFVLAAVRKNAQRLRFEQLLLLLVRSAVLILFALAIADPVLSWQAGESLTSAPHPTHYLFVVDTSYSMAFRSRDQTRLDAAKQAVQSVLESSQPGDGYSLLLLQNPVQRLIAESTTDRSELVRQLATVEVSHGGADLMACLRAIERQLESHGRRHSPTERVQVVFLTDLGRSTWDAVTSSECQTQLDHLNKRAQSSLIDLSDADASNVFVARLYSDRPSVTVGETARLEADVRSLGNSEPKHTRIEFFVSGRLIDSQQLVVPANGHAVAATDFRFDTAGDIPIEVRLSADSLLLDNDRWMVMPVHKSLNVLCVQGEPEAADYVALALNPAINHSADAPIRTTVIPESTLLEQSLQRYDCVMLCNIAQLSQDEKMALHRYLVEGGGLITVLGDRTNAQNYNQELSRDETPTRLLPARLEALVRDEVRLFDPLEYKHAIVAPFRGHERAGLLTVPTWCYYRLKPYVATAEIALAFDNQDPAIVVESIGRGRSVLVATALSPSSTSETADGTVPWTALPTWPSFPPLVDGLVRNAATGRDWPRNRFVTSPLEIQAPEPGTPRAQLTLPDRSKRQLELAQSGGVARATFFETSARGLYEVEFDKTNEKGSVARQRFAVNLDTRESDLRQMPRSMLPQELRPHGELEAGEPFLPPASGVTLFRYFLVAIAMLLGIEGGLACLFGRRAA